MSKSHSTTAFALTCEGLRGLLAKSPLCPSCRGFTGKSSQSSQSSQIQSREMAA